MSLQKARQELAEAEEKLRRVQAANTVADLATLRLPNGATASVSAATAFATATLEPRVKQLKIEISIQEEALSSIEKTRARFFGSRDELGREASNLDCIL